MHVSCMPDCVHATFDAQHVAKLKCRNDIVAVAPCMHSEMTLCMLHQTPKMHACRISTGGQSPAGAAEPVRIGKLAIPKHVFEDVLPSDPIQWWDEYGHHQE